MSRKIVNPTQIARSRVKEFAQLRFLLFFNSHSDIIFIITLMWTSHILDFKD